MGHISNSVINVGSGMAQVGAGLVQGVGASACGLTGHVESMKSLAQNSLANLDIGSKSFPLISECRDVIEGIAQGDLSKIALNAGILALTTVQGGSKKASSYVKSSKNMVTTAFTLCTVS